MVPVLLEVECWPVARHTASEPTNGETLTHGRPQPKRLAQLIRSTEQVGSLNRTKSGQRPSGSQISS